MPTILKTYTAWDKLAHALGGTIIFAAANLFLPSLLALAAVGVIGIAKEIYDKFHPANHTADIHDAIATVLGGVLGFVCTLKIY